MKTSLTALMLGTALALAAPSWGQAAEHAGRVLIAAGEVTVVRGTERIPAQSGTPVESGDTVELGPQSNAQLLMTDHSIIALRPQTTFRIKAYKFSGKSAPGEYAFLALLRGGMRTLTGIIGHVRHKEYHVDTPTATIGIRGTDYTVVYCDNNCRNANGSLAPNGTYGGVVGGRISVTNRSGVHVFGVNQFFRVASETSVPTQLIGPPTFLQDTLQGRGHVGKATARAESEGAKAESGGGGGTAAGSESEGTVAQTGLGGGSGDMSITSSGTSSTPTLVPTQTVTQATNTASPTNVLQTLTGTVFYHLLSTNPITVTSCSNPPCGTIAVTDFTLAVNYSTDQAYLKANFISVNQSASSNSTNTFNLGTPFNAKGIPVTVSGGQATINATFNRSNYPTQQGAFRCQGCSSNLSSTTPGYLDTISVSGTITGTQANLTLSGSSTGGGNGSFSVTLPQALPPSPYAGAMVIPGQTASDPTVARSGAGWSAQVASSGELINLGTFGATAANIGSAANTTVGSAPTYGNLVWGYWSGPGASITDYDYNSFTTTSGVEPWITGQVTPTLPSALGTAVSFSPVGSVVFGGGGTGTLNSATLTADFVNQSVSLNMNATSAIGNTYQMSGTSGVNSVGARFGAQFSSVSCSGTCSNGTPKGDFSGFFAGPNAEGAGVAFVAGYLGTSGTGVKGVVAFKR